MLGRHGMQRSGGSYATRGRGNQADKVLRRRIQPLADLICCNDAERLLLLRWATRVGKLCCRDRIHESTGHLHGFLDARPYMRARTQLAWTLRALGCYEEAVGHYEALLHAERHDHIAQGMLMTAYLELRRFDEARQHFDEYGDNGGTHLTYGEMIRCWLTGQDETQFQEALHRAFSSNQHVPQLLGEPKTPVEQSPFGVGIGAPDEAAEYLDVSHRLWDAYPKLKRAVLVAAKAMLPQIETERRERLRRLRGET